MFYTVYQTTNLVNGKIYVGSHQTESLDDDYLGSGNLIKAAIKKYGVASFKKEVLAVFDNPEAMSAKEAEIVTREFVDREDTYNLIPGGYQGDSYYQALKNVSPEKKSEWARAAYRARSCTPEQLSEWGKLGGAARVKEMDQDFYEAWARSGRDACQEKGLKPPSWKGKHHSEESKAKIAAKNSLATGEANTQFGTRWVWHPELGHKKIKADEPLELGWDYGRSPEWKSKMKGHTAGRVLSAETRLKMAQGQRARREQERAAK